MISTGIEKARLGTLAATYPSNLQQCRRLPCNNAERLLLLSGMTSSNPPPNLDNLIRDCDILTISTGIEKACLALVVPDPGIGPNARPSAGGLLLAPIWGVFMNVIEVNMFLFRFEHQIDLIKVLRDGLWRFNQFLLIAREVFDVIPLDRKIYEVSIF